MIYNIDHFSWTEKWLRRWRGIFCGHTAQTSSGGLAQLTGICRNAVRDLRNAYCANDGYSSKQKPETVLHAIRERLDCDIAFSDASLSFNKRTDKNHIKILAILTTVLFGLIVV